MSLTTQKRTILTSIYNDISSSGGFTGSIQKLYKAARLKDPNISVADVKEFLHGERSYTLHRGNLVRFPRRKILAPKPRTIIACDLGDFCSLQKYNNGVKYILICVDVYSRLMQTQTLKTKNSSEVLVALKKILEETPQFLGVRRIFTDRGREFYNKSVQNYFNKKNIKLYSVFSEMKSSIVERAIRTLKHKLYHYMTQANSLKYIHILPKVVDVYNHTFHRMLKNTPHAIHKLQNIEDIRRQFKVMYLNNDSSITAISPRLHLGQHVRLAKRRNIFHKGFWHQNTEEIFVVSHIDRTHPIPTYKIKDLNNETISGMFYEQELIATSLPDYFPVTVLQSRKTSKGHREYFVKWRGYPDSANSWIKAQDIVKFNKK